MPGQFMGGPQSTLLSVLLMLSQSGKEMEKSLDELMGFMNNTKSALEAMRSGMETFQAGLLKMAPPGQGRPPAWFGGPPPPPKPQAGIKPLPVESPAKPNDPGGEPESPDQEKPASGGEN